MKEADDSVTLLTALFVGAGRLVSFAEIAEAAGLEKVHVENQMAAVDGRLKLLGLELVWDMKGRGMVVVSPSYRPMVAKLNGRYVGREVLSTEAAETLALIQEKGPLTIKDMTRVRGANPRNALQTLLNLGLVQRAGRAEGRGGAWLYGALGGDAKIPWWFDSSSPERSGGGEKFAKNRLEPG